MDMFPFIPYRRISIDTALSLEAAKNTLKDDVTSEKPRFFLPFKEKKSFWGTISDHTFEIQRRINYRNSFLPNLRGQFIPTDHGTLIQVRMSMHPLVAVFMIIWVTPLVLFGVVFPLVDWVSAHNFAIRVELLEMMAFAYLLVFLGFGIEAIIAERRLKQIFAHPSSTSKAAHYPEPEYPDEPSYGPRYEDMPTIEPRKPKG